jgi:cyanophycinase
MDKGTLVLIGGNEDKDGERTVLREVVSVSRARRMAVIPSASDIPRRKADDYVQVFGDLGVDEVKVYDIRKPEEADRREYLEAVRDLDLAFFTGGDQVQLVSTLEGTRLIGEIRGAFERGMTVAGTSAGASALGDPMIYGEDDEDTGFRKGALRWSSGFGLLEGVTIDSHFFKRRRLPRLVRFLSSGRSEVGIGLGEDTAVVARPDGSFHVIGNGVAAAVSAREMTFTSFDDIGPDEDVSSIGLGLSFFSTGTTFCLNEGTVSVCGVPHGSTVKGTEE